MHVLNSVECYCPLLDEWHMMPSMLQPRKPQGVVAIGDSFYIIDGVDYDRDGKWTDRMAVRAYTTSIC